MRPNFVLEGPINAPAVFEEFMAVFPSTSGFVILGEKEEDLCNRVLNLKLSAKLSNLVISNDLLNVANTMDDFYSQTGRPTRALAFGRTRDLGKEVVVISASEGIHPGRALEDIKNRVRVRLAEIEGIL